MVSLRVSILACIAACSGESSSTVDSGNGDAPSGPPGCFQQVGKIEEPVPNAGDAFGSPLALDGDTAAAAATKEDVETILDRGAVYVLARGAGGWTHTSKLVGENKSDEFGTAIALRGADLLVGAPNNDGSPVVSESGSAYIYTRDGGGVWQPITKLRASNPAMYAAFGRQVAMMPGIAFVAAPLVAGGAGGTVSEVGAVYVFERDGGGTWNQTAILSPSDPQTEGHFGDSLVVSGATLIVGLGFDSSVTNGEVPGPGGAYVFEKDGGGAWTEVGKLAASAPESNSRMGYSIAFDGTTALVSAPAHSGQGGLQNAGLVQVFTRDATGWHDDGSLYASDAEAFDFFGASVGLGGDRALIAASLDDGPDNTINGTGAVYEFTKTPDGWVQSAKLYSSDVQYGLVFGNHSAQEGTHALISGGFKEGAGPLTYGAVYAFDCTL